MTDEDHVQLIRTNIDRATGAGATGSESLWGILRYVAKWRSSVLAHALIRRNGRRILAGPFEGMEYVDTPSEGSLAARLLGSYEAELRPHIERWVDGDLDAVVDIGCAEGYYAVGLARRLPSAIVHAYDLDPKARSHCADMAARNGVSDRVRIGEAFSGERFADFGPRTLVIVDIEGAEVDLLDPARFPGLAPLHLIVETHPGARPGATEMLIDRFKASHAVERVDHALCATPLPDWLRTGNHLDIMLAAWEWRTDATPWLVMTPRPPA